MVYPKFLDNLNAILSSGDIGADPEQSRWPEYEAILTQSMTWTLTSDQSCDPKATLVFLSGPFSPPKRLNGGRIPNGEQWQATSVRLTTEHGRGITHQRRWRSSRRWKRCVQLREGRGIQRRWRSSRKHVQGRGITHQRPSNDGTGERAPRAVQGTVGPGTRTTSTDISPLGR
jgi:hypothetical protein